MPGNSVRRPNQPASGPAVGSIFIGLGMGWAPDAQWDDGPKYRDTQTPTSSRKTCMDGVEYGDMLPSPLGRGLPSRNGFGKSF